MTSINKSSASNTNHSAAISRDEYSRIIWKLKCFESAIHIFHDKLIDLQRIDHSVLMTGAEVGVLDAYSRPKLPLIPRQSCHPFQTKAAIQSIDTCHPDFREA